MSSVAKFALPEYDNSSNVIYEVQGVPINFFLKICKKTSNICLSRDLDALLSLSGVVVVVKGDKLLFSSENKIYDQQIAALIADEQKMTAEEKSKIVLVVSWYSYDSRFNFIKDMATIGSETSDELIKCIVNVILGIEANLTPVPIKHSEMHLQASFIHPLIDDMTKNAANVVPLCSN